MKITRRALVIVLIFASLLSVFGCKKLFPPKPYEFINSKEDIEEISIVNVTYNAWDDYTYETLCVISDKDAFLSDFEKILFYEYLFGDPTQIGDGYAIYITYKNGDIEIIQETAQKPLYSEGYSGFGRQNCDREEFEALIDKYLTDNS